MVGQWDSWWESMSPDPWNVLILELHSEHNRTRSTHAHQSKLNNTPALQSIAAEAAVSAALAHVDDYLQAGAEGDVLSGWLQEAMEYTAGAPASFLAIILPETGVRGGS